VYGWSRTPCIILSYGSLNPQAIAEETTLVGRRTWKRERGWNREKTWTACMLAQACSQVLSGSWMERKERGSNERRAFCHGHTESKRWTFSGRISIERLSLESIVITLPRVIKDVALIIAINTRYALLSRSSTRLLTFVCVTN